MRRLLFDYYYWSDPDLCGQAIRDKDGQIQMILVENSSHLYKYNYYMRYIGKIFVRII